MKFFQNSKNIRLLMAFLLIATNFSGIVLAVNDADIISDVAEGIQESTGCSGFDVQDQVEGEEGDPAGLSSEQANGGDEVPLLEESSAAEGDADKEDRNSVDADNAETILGQKNGGSISGRVTDDENNPIEGLWVTAFAEDEDSSSAATDPSGYYTLAGLSDDTYRVWVSGQGDWVSQYYNGVFRYQDADPVVLTNSQDITGIDFSLFKGGSISGRVEDASGNPIEEAYLGAYSAAAGWITASSNEEGEYRISRLPTGHYQVRVVAGGFATRYYNGVFNPEEADLVFVTAGEDTAGIHFSMCTGGSISGRVVDREDNPVEGVYVYASGVGFGSGSGHTNEQGYYLIPALPYNDYRVRFEIGEMNLYYDGVYSFQEATLVPVTGDETVSGIDFKMSNNGSISGTVTDEDGNPLEEVRVQAYGEEIGKITYTNEEGEYTLSGLWDGSYFVRAAVSGWVSQYYHNAHSWDDADSVSIIDSLNVTGIDFVLFPAGSISGRVLNQEGNPLEEASVEAYSPGLGWYSVGCGEEGYYTITGLPEGSYRIRASAGEYLSQYYDGVHNADVATLVFVARGEHVEGIGFNLGIGGSISGHVLDIEGNPIAGVNVYADVQEYGWRGEASTDDLGFYHITGLPDDAYHVRATADGWVSQYYNGALHFYDADPVIVSNSQDVTGIDFQLYRGGSISGRVVDESENPLDWAHVKAYASGVGWFNTRSDEDGYYTLRGLPPGEYRVEAWAEGFLYQLYDGVYDYEEATLITISSLEEVEGINFVMNRGGSISGYVLDDVGSPIEGAWVYADGTDYGGWGSAYTDALGYYTITKLHDDAYRVRAGAVGRVGQYYNGVTSRFDADLVIISNSGNITDINFVLNRGGSISGRVVTEDGSPVQEAEVMVYPLEFSYEDESLYAFTDSMGYYTISGFPANEYIVAVRADGYINQFYNGADSWNEATAIIITGEDVVEGIDFVLREGGKISGRVVDQAGNPIPWAEIMARAQDAPFRTFWAVTDPGGYFTIVGLPEGSYIVRASSCDYVAQYYDGVYSSIQATPVSITGLEEVQDINFVLHPGGGISGQVLDENENPVAGAWVHAYGQSYGFGVALTDDEGFYIISRLPYNDYRLQVSAEGFLTQYYDGVYRQIEVTPVGVFESAVVENIDHKLKREEYGTISGTITDVDTGAPISGSIHAEGFSYQYGYFIERVGHADGEGNYLLELPAAEYSLTFKHGDYWSVINSDFWVEAGASVVLDVEMAAKTFGTLTGTILYDDTEQGSGAGLQANGGAPVQGAVLHIYNEDLAEFHFAYTDAQGAFSIQVPAAEYTVVVYDYGNPYWPVYMEGILVEEGDTTVFTADMTPMVTTTLKGRVTTAATGEPVVGALVGGERLGYRFETMTDIQGNYSVSVAAGEGYVINVYAQQQGYTLSRVKDVALEAGMENTLDFELKGLEVTTITGYITDQESGGPLVGAAVFLVLTTDRFMGGLTTETDETGYFVFEDYLFADVVNISLWAKKDGYLREDLKNLDFVEGEVNEFNLQLTNVGGAIKYGDANGDGYVDVGDAILVLRYIVGLVALTPEQIQAADVAGSGVVDVADAILILRYIVGLIDSFPAEG